MATTSDTTTLEYYQSIYTHCKQRFNIPDGIEVIKKSLGTEDLNSETLATYFQKLNFNIIKYCEETYSVQFQYSIDFESETETSNKDKQKLKQYLKTTPNTPILPKTTAKHLQTPEQKTSVKLPLSITSFPISLKSNHSESLESEETESKQEETTENEKEIATAYIAKIPEFTGEDNDTSPQKWLDKAQKAKDANGWIAARMLKAIPIFSKELQENAGLKDKLIKKVCPHAPADLVTVIRHAKNYEIAIKKANHTKLINLAIRETSSAAEEKIDQLIKKVESYFTNQQQQQQQSQRYQPPQQHNQNNFGSPSNNQPQNCKVAVPKTNPSNHTILPAQIAQNFNLSDIFLFEFKANESPFLLSNAAANEQKVITAMYTKAIVEGKPIRLILNSGSTESIITYQLMQQLQRTVDRPAQTVIVTADGIKKTPVGKIDNFPFTIDGITISIKVLVIDAPQYQALVGNNWLFKANTNLDWETQELKISYQGQHTIVSVTCGTFNKQSEKAPVFEFEKEKKMPLTETYMALGSTSNWAEKTEQEIFEESKG
ncbi:hypothetical protein G9A89_001117 [Geosiphon pyriformis]|nr:hypothetical protein G9A89_001117 [Geosiphon pyriformis]